MLRNQGVSAVFAALLGGVLWLLGGTAHADHVFATSGGTNGCGTGHLHDYFVLPIPVSTGEIQRVKAFGGTGDFAGDDVSGVAYRDCGSPLGQHRIQVCNADKLIDRTAAAGATYRICSNIASSSDDYHLLGNGEPYYIPSRDDRGKYIHYIFPFVGGGQAPSPVTRIFHAILREHNSRIEVHPSEFVGPATSDNAKFTKTTSSVPAGANYIWYKCFDDKDVDSGDAGSLNGAGGCENSTRLNGATGASIDLNNLPSNLDYGEHVQVLIRYAVGGASYSGFGYNSHSSGANLAGRVRSLAFKVPSPAFTVTNSATNRGFVTYAAVGDTLSVPAQLSGQTPAVTWRYTLNNPGGGERTILSGAPSLPQYVITEADFQNNRRIDAQIRFANNAGVLSNWRVSNRRIRVVAPRPVTNVSWEIDRSSSPEVPVLKWNRLPSSVDPATHFYIYRGATSSVSVTGNPWKKIQFVPRVGNISNCETDTTCELRLSEHLVGSTWHYRVVSVNEAVGPDAFANPSPSSGSVGGVWYETLKLAKPDNVDFMLGVEKNVELGSATGGIGGRRTYSLELDAAALPAGLEVKARFEDGSTGNALTATTNAGKTTFSAEGAGTDATNTIVGLNIGGNPSGMPTSFITATYSVQTHDSTHGATAEALDFTLRVLGHGDPPDPPTNAPTLGTVDASGLPLSWSKPADSTGFQIHIGIISSDFTDSQPIGVTVADAGCATGITCAYTVPHNRLTPGMNNYFRIAASNSAGDSTSLSPVSEAWASPATLNWSDSSIATPSGSISVTFVAGTTSGTRSMPESVGGLMRSYAFSGISGVSAFDWLEADTTAQTLSVKSGSRVPSATESDSLPRITYTVSDSRDADISVEISVLIQAPTPLVLTTENKTFTLGQEVAAFSAGTVTGGGGDSFTQTYALTLEDGGDPTTALAALGLAATATEGETPIRISGTATTPGSVRLIYTVREDSGVADASSNFSITVLSATVTDGELADTAVPEIMHAINATIATNIGARVRAVRNGEADKSKLQLDGADDWDSFIFQNAHAEIHGGQDWKKVFGNSRFSFTYPSENDLDLPLNGYWGQGNYQTLSGEKDGIKWDGSLLGLSIGTDTVLETGNLFGVAFNRQSGSFDVTKSGRSGGYDLSLNTVSPYVSGEFMGYEYHASVHIGRGKFGAHSLKNLGASAGSSRFFRDNRFGAQHLKGDFIFSGAKVGGANVDAGRLRVLLEQHKAQTLPNGWELHLTGDIGGRLDLGAGGGLGVEAVGQARYIRGLITTYGQLRTLLFHSDDVSEFGLQVRVQVAPGQDGQGLSLQLTPSYGESESGLSDLWEYGVAKTGISNSTASSHTDYIWQMDARLGFGLRLKDAGLLTPYASTRYGDAPRIGFGVNWKPRMRDLELDLSGEQSETQQRVLLKGSLGF